jgi:hypothetical protein
MSDDWDNGDREYDPDDDTSIAPGDDIDIFFENEDDIEEMNIKNVEIITKKSMPIMYEYEMANVIKKRQMSIDKGAKSTMESEVKRLKITSSYDIVCLEFKTRKLPNFRLIRKFDHGYYEVWRNDDFIYFPKL